MPVISGPMPLNATQDAGQSGSGEDSGAAFGSVSETELWVVYRLTTVVELGKFGGSVSSPRDAGKGEKATRGERVIPRVMQ